MLTRSALRAFASFTWTLAAITAAVACSSSSSTGGGTSGAAVSMPTTSLDTSRTVSQLDAADAAQLCQDLDTWSAQLITTHEDDLLACSLTASFEALGTASGASSVSACTSSFEACMAHPPVSADAGPGSSTCTTSGPSNAQSCDATIADLFACMHDQMVSLKTTVDALDATTFCEGLAQDAATSEATPPSPASCQKIAAQCPGLFGGLGSGDGSSASSSSSPSNTAAPTPTL